MANEKNLHHSRRIMQKYKILVNVFIPMNLITKIRKYLYAPLQKYKNFYTYYP